MNQTPEKSTSTSASSQPQQIVTVQRIYNKSSSFEAVQMTTDILQKPPIPIIDMQAQANFYTHAGEADIYEAVLTLNLNAKVDGNILWRLQMQQAGLYIIKGFDEEQRKLILNGHCMNQLYPYANAAITATVLQAGFPPVYLNPMNFEMLYREQLRQEAEKKTEKELVD